MPTHTTTGTFKNTLYLLYLPTVYTAVTAYTVRRRRWRMKNWFVFVCFFFLARDFLLLLCTRFLFFLHSILTSFPTTTTTTTPPRAVCSEHVTYKSKYLWWASRFDGGGGGILFGRINEPRGQWIRNLRFFPSPSSVFRIVFFCFFFVYTALRHLITNNKKKNTRSEHDAKRTKRWRLLCFDVPRVNI